MDLETMYKIDGVFDQKTGLDITVTEFQVVGYGVLRGKEFVTLFSTNEHNGATQEFNMTYIEDDMGVIPAINPYDFDNRISIFIRNHEEVPAICSKIRDKFITILGILSYVEQTKLDSLKGAIYRIEDDLVESEEDADGKTHTYTVVIEKVYLTEVTIEGVNSKKEAIKIAEEKYNSGEITFDSTNLVDDIKRAKKVIIAPDEPVEEEPIEEPELETVTSN